MENKKKKIIIFSIIGVAIILIIVLSTTYAYWRITKEQTEVNVVGSDCFNIDFIGENDITLNNAFPLDDDELENFLGSATPYHFTITNQCSSLASATINLESLNAGTDKQLADEWIDAILYEDDYHNKLNKNTKLTLNPNNDENKVIEDSLHVYKLKSFTLKANEQKDYYLLLYMDQKTPLREDTQNASWQGKITLSADYKVDKFANAGILRKLEHQYYNYGDENDGYIETPDESGMWEYRYQITKIVIEPTISEKVAGDNETLYGPFEEGSNDKPVQSYVICNEYDECTGYLQGNGGIKLNPDSTGLFALFEKLQEIDGMEYLDTSEVTNMSLMFYGDENLRTLDLSNFDTSNVTNMVGMFNSLGSNEEEGGAESDESSDDYEIIGINLNTNVLNLSSFDTSKVINMYGMFTNVKIENLDLSNFDTSHVTDISLMFAGAKITNLNLNGLDFSKVNNTESIINGNYIFGKEGFNMSCIIQTINMDNVKFPKNSNYFFKLLNVEDLSLKNISINNAENMFYQITANTVNLSRVDLTGKDLVNENLTDKDTINGMFANAYINNLYLNNIDFSSLKPSYGDYYDDIFSFNIFCNSTDYDSCEEPAYINYIDISNSKLPSNANYFFNNIFSNNNEITINLENVDTSNVTTIIEFFPNIEVLNIENFVFPKNSSDMFQGNTASTINFNNIDTSNVTNMYGMFCDMENIQKLDLKLFNTENVTDMSYMFENCVQIQELDLSSFDTRNVINMDAMFSFTYNIQNLDLSSFDTRNVLNMSHMFYNDTSLTKITYGPNFIHNDNASISDMFYGCFANKPDSSVLPSWKGIF